MKSQEQARQCIAALARARRAACIMHCDDVYLARAHAQIVHVLIVLLSLLCTYSLLPLFCLSTQTYSLGALNATVHVSSCQQSCMVIHSVYTSALQLHRGISTLVLLIVFVITSCFLSPSVI